MANLVEFIVKIRDMGSGTIMQLARNTEGAFSRMNAKVKSVGSSIDQLDKQIDALTKTRDISINTAQIRRANAEIEALERKRGNLENAGRGGGMGMLSKSMIMGGAMAVAAAGAYALNKGMDRQLAGTSFQVMAGQKDGDKLHKNLINFATDTIYGNEVFGEGKMMLGFGVAAKNVMPSMKMLGDIAMGDVEHMKSLTLGFSEAAAAGKLTGRELLIMIDAGFNPLQSISAKTGRSMADLRKDMEKGKISFQDLAGAMEYATGPQGRFHDGMARIADTPTGKWMVFSRAIGAAAGTIGMQLLPALGGIIDFFNWMGANQSVMYGVVAGIAAMTVAWGLFTLVTQWAVVWQTILSIVAFWPILAIGLFVGAVVWLVKSLDGWGKSVKALWQIIKDFFSIVGTTFKDAFQEWLYFFDLLFLKAKSTFQFVGQLISNVVQAMKLALSGDFTGAKNILTAHITTDADKDIDKLKKERASQQLANAKSMMSDMKDIGKQWGNVGLTKHKSAPGDKSASDWMNSKLDFKGAGGAPPAGAEDTNKGISGGGVRNLTINIAKQGIDQITIHAATLTEGKEQIKNIFVEMFDQVLNSGNAAVNPN